MQILISFLLVFVFCFSAPATEFDPINLGALPFIKVTFHSSDKTYEFEVCDKELSASEFGCHPIGHVPQSKMGDISISLMQDSDTPAMRAGNVFGTLTLGLMSFYFVTQKDVFARGIGVLLFIITGKALHEASMHRNNRTLSVQSLTLLRDLRLRKDTPFYFKVPEAGILEELVNLVQLNSLP